MGAAISAFNAERIRDYLTALRAPIAGQG